MTVPRPSRRRRQRIDPAEKVQADAIRRARREAVSIERLAARMRLASFRAWMRSTVSRMSSLVPALLEQEGVALNDALTSLRPSAAWEAVTRHGPSYGGWMHGVAERFYLGLVASTSGVLPSRCDVQAELVLRCRASSSDHVVLNVVEHGIEIAVYGAGYQLATALGIGRLFVDQDLPEIAAAACIGHPIEEVTDLPLLVGRGLTVDSADRLSGGWVIGFAVDVVGLDLPWSTRGAPFATNTVRGGNGISCDDRAGARMSVLTGGNSAHAGSAL